MEFDEPTAEPRRWSKSLSSVMIAVFIFGIAYAVMRAVQEWLDNRLLPRTTLDPGLRNSITTSLGYLGFLVAIGLSLGYLGLSFQNLAIVAGALSVGIGFGLQSIVNNFVSGLIDAAHESFVRADHDPMPWRK